VDALHTEIPGGLHVARYGGGGDYASVEPLVSCWVTSAEAGSSAAWDAARSTLAECTVESLQLGAFAEAFASVLPGAAIQVAEELRVEPAVHLVVSRMPATEPEMRDVYNAELGDYEKKIVVPEGHGSLMLHGFLFSEYYSSGRLAHQKFPLLAVTSPRNVAPPGEGPQWLRIDGKFVYADQHVHADQGVDIGLPDGQLFAEVFFGSDMARVALEDPQSPASLWAVGLDLECGRAIVARVALLPSVDAAQVEAEAAVDHAIKAASSMREVREAMRARWGAIADTHAVL